MTRNLNHQRRNKNEMCALDRAISFGLASHWNRLFAIGMVMIIGWTSIGCGPKEQISAYKMRKDKKKVVNEEVQENWRMVVGLLQLEKECWIFKLHGTESDVLNTKKQWQEFFASIGGVDQEIPTWTVPQGWTRASISQMAVQMGGYQNFNIPDTDPPLQMKISRLGGQQDLYTNIVRWRGQLGLAHIAKSDLETQIERTEHADGKLIIFDQLGRKSGGGGMMGGGGRRKSGPLRPNQVVPKQPQVDFTIPEGWKELKNVPVVVTKIAKVGAEDKISISLTQMSPDFNDWNENVGLWADDLNTKINEEQIASQTLNIRVDSVPARQIVIHPETVSESSQSIIGVMFEKSDHTWFVKMKGNSDLVKQDAGALEQFLKSLKID